jgi:outer membrane protein TolC
MRLSAALSVALVAVASLRAEAPPLQGTMPEDLLPGLKPLLQTAVERSPNTISAAINVEQAEAAKTEAFSALYPNASLNGNYAVNTASEANSPDNTSRGFFYGAGVSQPVFQWGAYKNAALIGSLGLKIADRQYAEAYRTLAILIREQYMLLIQKRMQFRNDDFKNKIAQEDLAAQQARFESGASSEAELQTFKLALEDASLKRDRSQDDFEYSKQQFMRLVGVESLDDSAIPIELPHPEYSASLADAVYSGFVGNGIESTFQSQVYDMQVKEDDLNYQIARVKLLPKVGASANYSYSNATQVGSGTVSQYKLSSYNYGLSMNWNIFDGFYTKAAKVSALASKRADEQRMKNYVDATVDSIGEMRRQLGFSARSLSLYEVHNALIGAQVQRLNADQALGFASQATIDAGKLNLYATEFDMTNARSDYLGRWTEFVSLAGLDPAIENISPRYDR